MQKRVHHGVLEGGACWVALARLICLEATCRRPCCCCCPCYRGRLRTWT